MDYERSVEFAGDRRKALEVAQTTFIQAGFRIEDVSDSSISARYEGSAASRRCHPLCSASPVAIEISGRHFIVTGGDDAVRQMRRFIIRLMGAFAAFYGVGMGILLAFLGPGFEKSLMSVGIILGLMLIELPIFLVVGPATVRKRATQALDTLIHNMTVLC